MTYEGLLIHTIEVFNPTVGTEDRYGDEIPGVDAGTSESARIQQNESSEDIIDRDTRITTFTAFLTTATVMTALSRVEWDGRTFRVSGEPAIRDNAIGPHHVEATLVEVSDDE